VPLEPGKSQEAISHNIETEMHHGHPQKQAIAIAYREAGLSRSDAEHPLVEWAKEEAKEPEHQEGKDALSIDAPIETTEYKPVGTLPENVTQRELNEYNRRFWAQESEPVQDEHVGFKKLEGELEHKEGVRDPAAVAAAIGIKKYGKAGMAKKAEAGRK